MNILIIIPVYNHTGHLPGILSSLHESGHSVCVIDDGSDPPVDCPSPGDKVIFIRHDQNRGKGAALKTGFYYAVKQGFQGVITMDGDGQHSPGDLPGILKYAESFDIVLGTRDLNHKNMPFSRKLSNRLTSFFISAAVKQKVPDSQCGYRFIRTDVLKGITLESDGYEMETELLVKAAVTGRFSMGFCPVRTIYNNSGSSIKKWRDTWRVIRVYFKSLRREA